MPNVNTPTGSGSGNSDAINTVYAQPKGTGKKKPAAKKTTPAKPAPAPAAPSGQAKPAKSSGGTGSPQWFARKVLAGLGLPTTQANVDWMVAWESREGGHWENTARYNPLNTTLNMPGSGTMNSVGVRVYSSWKQGIEATVQTLASGLYGDIRQALSTGKIGLGDHFSSLETWSGGGYDNVSGGSPNYHPTGSGGGGGGGSYDAAGGTPGTFGNPKQMTVQQYLDDPSISADYGYLTAFLKNPAIGPVLAKAAQEGWGANQLLGAFNNKKEFPAAYAWWHKTAASARAWQAQQKLDPATANQRLTAMERQVQTLAQSTLGYKLDAGRLTQLSNHAIAFNWSQQDLQHAVGAEFHYNAAQQKYLGAAGQTLDQLKQLSSNYLVPLSDHALNQWTRGVLEGVYQPKDFEDYVKQQAISLYPTLKSALDGGTTTKQYLNPYAQIAAQTLEVSPDSINWFDPKWSKALNTTTPDGQRAPMSLSDWSTYLRGLPDYQTTQGATDQAYSFGENILKTFGKVG